MVFIIFLICVKSLSQYEFGLYKYVLTGVFFLIIFGDFGISTATSKYVAEYNITDKNKLKSVLFNSGIIILGLTLIIAMLTLVFGPLYFKENYIYVLYLLPLVFLAPMTSLYDGIYRGLKKFKQLAVASISVGPISLILAYFLIKKYGLTGALISQIVVYLLLLLVLAVGYSEYNFKINREVMKEVGLYGFTYGLAIVGNYLFIRFGILILGYYGYINQIAVYGLLDKILAVLVMPFIILGQVLAPIFTSLYTKKKYKIVYNKLKKYTLTFFILGICGSLFLYFVLPILIKIFIPHYYNTLLFSILPFSLIIFATNIWGATIDMGIVVPTGHAGLMAKLYMVLGILGALSAIILVKNYGYLGIMYSLATSSFLMVLSLRIFFFRELKKHLT